MSKASKKKTSRKYLGDRDDPHFVPSSPILSRQTLTAQQEDELTRSCELVLSGVPTSDDYEDNLIHTANQLVPKPTKTSEKDVASRPKYPAGAPSEYSHKSRKVRHVQDDTATPSETSKRTTIDRTNASTPMTIFSENLNRRSSSRQNGGLRGDIKSYKSQLHHEFSKTEHMRRALTDSKSMACLRSSAPDTGTTPAVNSASKSGNLKMSHLEFNKSLPCLPLDNQIPSEKQSAGFSRLFKSRKNKKVGATADVAELTQSGVTNIPRSQTLPPGPDTKKNKFNFTSLFDRRKRQLPRQVLAV